MLSSSEAHVRIMPLVRSTVNIFLIAEHYKGRLLSPVSP